MTDVQDVALEKIDAHHFLAVTRGVTQERRRSTAKAATGGPRRTVLSDIGALWEQAVLCGGYSLMVPNLRS